MRFLAVLTLVVLGGTLAARAQSLAEVAEKEKERRQKLKGQPAPEPREPEKVPASPTLVEERDQSPDDEQRTALDSLADAAEQETVRRRNVAGRPVQSFDDRHLAIVHFGRRAVEPSDREPSKEIGAASAAQEAPTLVAEEAGTMAALAEETPAAIDRDVEFLRAGGGYPTTNAGAERITATRARFGKTGEVDPENLFLRGTVYADWYRSALDTGFSTNLLGNRVKLEMGRPPGAGWRVFLDVRNRFNKEQDSNLLLIYDTRLIYDDHNSPVELSIGQMNLYNSAGVGQLLGGVMGYRVSPSFTLGGYGGLQPDLYGMSVDPGYQKYGFYSQYRGAGAATAALSYNAVRFGGSREREFVYTSGLAPLGDFAVLYGNLEYELGGNLAQEDRLSHLFLNARYNVTGAVDISAHYSTGRGLDFHRFLIEQSQAPDRNSPDLERFFYSKTYGVRVSAKPHPRLRMYVAQRESEQKDRAIRNHTTQIGGSSTNIAGTGLSLYGNYNINRGDASESDSYRISVGRDFGRLAWTAYYSSTFNGIRYDTSTELPVIVRMSDRSTISNDIFFSVSSGLTVSFEYDYASNGTENESSLFFRAIFRVRE